MLGRKPLFLGSGSAGSLSVILPHGGKLEAGKPESQVFQALSHTESRMFFPLSPGKAKWVSVIHTSVWESPPRALSSQHLDEGRVPPRAEAVGRGVIDHLNSPEWDFSLAGLTLAQEYVAGGPQTTL